jgi:hypothetical protein
MLGIFTPSILWAIGGALVAILIPVGTWALHTPSKVTLAVSAEHAKGEMQRLKDANASMAAVIAEEQKAAREAKARAAAKDAENQSVRAALLALETENNALKKPRTDDGTAVFDPGDDWLLRNAKARANGGAGAASR